MPFEMLRDNLLKRQEIMNSLPIWAHQDLPDGLPFMPSAGRVFTFKIEIINEAAYWIHLDIQEEATLHRMYVEVTRYFYFNRNDEYSFFHGETENPFTEYALPRRGRKPKNNSDIKLVDLDFEYSRVLTLVVHNQGDDAKRQVYKLRAEMLGEKVKEPRTAYPSLTKMSKAIREVHETEDEDLF
jgi:hypothetical protein